MTIEKGLVIFDIDGTVCDITQRLHHINFNASIHYKPEYFKKNWEKFYADCIHDEPKENVIKILHIMQMFWDIKFFTGRSDQVREATLEWLDTNLQLVTIDLTMRKHHDYRHDYVIKKEMYDALSSKDKGRLVCVFEDRDQVVEMWRGMGITCCQVDRGDF